MIRYADDFVICVEPVKRPNGRLARGATMDVRLRRPDAASGEDRDIVDAEPKADFDLPWVHALSRHRVAA